jgi:hypothetical protein
MICDSAIFNQARVTIAAEKINPAARNSPASNPSK